MTTAINLPLYFSSGFSAYPYPASSSSIVVPSLFQPEFDTTCELCGKGTYKRSLHECDLCGKKVCHDCARYITKFTGSLVWASCSTFYSTSWSSPAGTVWVSSTPTFSSSLSAKEERDLIICVSCCDLLKLSLRIAAAKGLVEKDEEDEVTGQS